MSNIFLLNGGRIISATRSDEDFLYALKASPEVIFDLDPDLMNVSVKLKKAHDANKKLFIHIDLAKGIGKDESGVRFLKRIGVDGVISTKVNIIKMARECGMLQLYSDPESAVLTRKFAELCGLHRTYISDIECFRRSISLDNIQKIADALGVETHILFMEEK